MPSETINSKLWTAFDRRWRASIRFRYLVIAAMGVGILAIPAGCLVIATVFHNPGVGMGLLFVFGGGTFLSLTLFGSLRRGVVTVGRFGSGSVYERRRNPFGFWFYISLFTFIYSAVTIVGLVFVIHPFLLNNQTRQHRTDPALKTTQTAP